MKETVASILLVCIAVGLPSCGSPQASVPPNTHPDVSKWDDVFKPDLSNAVFPEGVWTCKKGALSATEDKPIWTKKEYDRFIVDLEFKTEPGSNSGVMVYCTNMNNWPAESVEVQITDDFAEKWATSPKTWQCGAIFGHLAPKKSMVRKPGKWNRYTITCKHKDITVMLNGEVVTEMDMGLWTNATKNPDGSDSPAWCNIPLTDLPTHGRIGLQGKHAGTPTYFRNVKIKELPSEKD